MMQPVEQPIITPWRPWEAIPVALAALCASILAAVILGATGAEFEGVPLVLSAIALSLSLFGFSLAWVSLRHRQGISALGLRSERAAGDLAMGAWFGVGLFGVVGFAILPLVYALWTVVTGDPPDQIDQPIVPGDPSTLEIVLGGLAVVVAAPLGEEVFFRGFLFESLRGRLGFLRAGAISAVVFAIFHGDPLLMILMFFVGMALAWLYERRGSLIAPIGAHAMFNVIGYTLILMDRA
jgi:membrane protease YdiL (CAAX protease family)